MVFGKLKKNMRKPLPTCVGLYFVILKFYLLGNISVSWIKSKWPEDDAIYTGYKDYVAGKD